MTVDMRHLYGSPVEALMAACKAADAPCYGINQSARYDMAWGLWTDRDKAEMMADGLRLTGYDVALLPGFSTGVVIKHPPPALP